MIRRPPPLVSPTPRRRASEPVVPMINVVFLLLIFFLMTAQIVPPDPFGITLPEATGDTPDEAAPLYISASGETAFADLRGDAAVRAAAEAGPVSLQVDAALEAVKLARLLRDLKEAGADDVQIVTLPGAP